MFILNQNKNIIVNTIPYNSIGIKDRQIIATLNETTICILGEYSYEGRAKEVLEDIVKKAELGCQTYTMPEE